MGINFPASPAINDLYPVPAVVGIPQYKWDGTAWLAYSAADPVYVQKAGDTMTGHLSLPATPAAANAVRRDFVEAYAAPFNAMAYNGMQINGSMEVSQERGNTSFSLLNNTLVFVQDGWGGTQSSPTLLLTIYPADSGPPGFSNGLSVSVGTPSASPGSNDYTLIWQNIEGYRVARLAWGTASAQPITVGFWVRSDVPGNIGVAARNADNSRVYIVDVPVTATWTFQVVSIPGCTDGTWNKTNGTGLSLSFCPHAGANLRKTANSWLTVNGIATPATGNLFSAGSTAFRLAGVVVLPGTQVPTAAQSPLIMRPYDQELLTCQRYYEIARTHILGTATAASQYFSHRVKLVAKRSTPTVTVFNSISHSNDLSGLGFNNQTGNGVTTYCQAAAAATTEFVADISADARL